MMLLGNTEALGVSRLQIEKLSPTRNVTIAMMSMSCVTAAIIGAYTTMVPGQYVITAIPLNILGAIVITSVLNPVTIKPEEDFVVDASGNIEYCDPEYLAELAEKEAAKTKAKKSASKDSKSAAKGSKSKSKLIDIENDATYSGDGKTAHGKDLEDTKRVKLPPFFMFLGDSILNAGKLILIILANVIAFVAIAETINRGLDLIPFINTLTGGGKEVTDAITGLPAVAADGSAVLTYGEPLQYLFGIVLSPIAVLFGFNFTEAFEMAKLMGTKLVTNEFVVMGQLGGPEAFVAAHSAHYVAVLTVFLTSFANFSTVGMVIGCYKGIADEKSNEAVASQVPRIFLSGVLVSVLSAAVAGMFCW
jgi:nucleoside permease NupC